MKNTIPAGSLLHIEGRYNDTITFRGWEFQALGSSIPLLLERDKTYNHFSVTLPKEKQNALIFFQSSEDNHTSFFEIKREASGQARAELKKFFSPSCEMVVDWKTITIKTSNGNIYTTGDKSGSYKVAYDAMCRFLIEDITEEELLAEAVKLAEETSGIELLHREISDLKAVIQVKDEIIESKEVRLRLIHCATKESWWSCRLSRIRKMTE